MKAKILHLYINSTPWCIDTDAGWCKFSVLGWQERQHNKAVRRKQVNKQLEITRRMNGVY